MFEQTFKNIDDILFKDAGADSELDYIGQTSWIMFLRYLSHEQHELSSLYESKIKNMGKTNPLNDKDMAEFVNLQKTKAQSEKSWTISIADIDKTTGTN